jgi:hypothetical protein
MSQATGEKTDRPAAARVEERSGLFAGLTRLSIEYARNVQQLLAEQRKQAASDTGSGQSAVTRAEERLDSLGQRIGLFAVRARLRIQDAGKTLGFLEGRSKMASGTEPGQPATEKAEELVNRMGQRINRLSNLASQNVVKATAYVHEEAEDVWVEAQSIRRNMHQQNFPL